MPSALLRLCYNRLYGIFATRYVQYSKVRLTFQDESSREVIITMSVSMLGGPYCLVGMENLVLFISIIV